MSVRPVNFRIARDAALDTPADLDLARAIHAPHLRLPISRTHEVILREIREHEAEIARRAQAIRWLKLSLETEHV